MAGAGAGLLVLMLLWQTAAALPERLNGAHPLDPLSADEIVAAGELLKAAGRLGGTLRLNGLTLEEPPKEEVLRYRGGETLSRRAAAVVYDKARGELFEAVVDLSAQQVVSWRRVPGAKPSFVLEDFVAVAEIVKRDARWRDALARRGITDLQNVQVETGPAGYYGPSPHAARRLARAVCYYRGASWNAYGRPIEGLAALVDLDRGEVLELTDTGNVPLPPAGGADLPQAPARDAKPLEVVQAEGPDFEIRGHEVRWQGWRFRYGFSPREGLILYTVGYEDRGRLRSILYRGSLSEMVVPYADSSPAWFFRNAFDVGEYGVGWGVVPLEALTDVPANAVVLPVTLASAGGRPVTIERGVALFERDAGPLWKHFDYLTGRAETRRARELVAGFTASAANYTYAFEWIFHQDGTLEVQVLLTGVMQVKAVEAAAAGSHHARGHRVTPSLEAIHHQHFFSFRLDLDVDGAEDNAVLELNTVPAAPSRGGGEGSAFRLVETPLRSEMEARRTLSLASSRTWKIVNRSERNALGEAVGYTLVPGENAVPLAAADSWVRRRAGFLDGHVWVTPYDPAQLYAAGSYVNQSHGDDGLAAWVKARRPIEGRDIVLWYTLGVTHLPRPEDWPVMSVHRAGFKLVPSGFFPQNPALDVVRPQ